MPVKKSLLLLVAAIFSAAFVKGQNTFNKPRMDSLLNLLDADHKDMLSLTVSHNDTIVYQRAIGYSNLNGNQQVQADVKTKYRIGSGTKMFTAVMIFQLIEEGKLNINNLLSSYYPQLPNAQYITIAQMLQHRSGLHNFIADTAINRYRTKGKTERQMLDIFASQPPDFTPNSKAAYSNTNYILLGYIIEKITGKTYAENLQERITSKIALTDTYYGDKIKPENHEARSFRQKNGQWQINAETDISLAGGAAGIVSTPTDLTMFIQALAEGKLINAAHLELMRTFRDGYGMGFIHVALFPTSGYGYEGKIDGFNLQLIYSPTYKLAIACIENGKGGAADEVLDCANAAYFNEPYIVPRFDKYAVSENQLEKYAGVYHVEGFKYRITVGIAHGGLVAQGVNEPPIKLKATGPNLFEYNTQGLIIRFDTLKHELIMGREGVVQGVYTRILAEPKLAATDLDKYLGVYASADMPIKIKVTKNNDVLITEGTAPHPLVMEYTGPDAFEFSDGDAMLKFDTTKNEMILLQGWHKTIFTREK